MHTSGYFIRAEEVKDKMTNMRGGNSWGNDVISVAKANGRGGGIFRQICID
jgi:hypothetical protein